jgi:phosphoribosylamine--glycine ligase
MAKILVVGGGGREHALGWSISQHADVETVYFAKGNPGTRADEKCQNLIIDGTKKENFHDLLDFVNDNRVDMIVVGPEQPLVDGIVDYFHAADFRNIFGPTSNAALIEADKFYSYEVMDRAGIPQARSIPCYNIEAARKAIPEVASERGVVLKARGLTGGKGVSVFDTQEQASSKLEAFIKAYGQELLVAERLYSEESYDEEFSVFGISDGERVIPFIMSIQDHKRLLNNDKGPNTGGMGAYGPATVANSDIVRMVADKMMTPLVRKMKELGNEYKGFLYAGVMMTKQGPKILEYNCRFGDPEAQPSMMMLKNGLYMPLRYALEGDLRMANIEFNEGAAVCIVMAANGYPDSNYVKQMKGSLIGGLDDVKRLDNTKVFHAGTSTDEQGRVITDGGRVLGVTARSDTVKDAIRKAYVAADRINELTTELNNRNVFIYRRDIADKALR